METRRREEGRKKEKGTEADLRETSTDAVLPLLAPTGAMPTYPYLDQIRAPFSVLELYSSPWTHLFRINLPSSGFKNAGQGKLAASPRKRTGLGWLAIIQRVPRQVSIVTGSDRGRARHSLLPSPSL